MRRRAVVLGAAVAAFGGCSARGRDGRSSGNVSTTPTATDGPEPTASERASPSPTPRSTTTPAGPEREAAVRSAREHLAVAFDELREMRPVGPENIRVSADRFRASDHERARAAVSAAETALERVGTADGDAEVEGLRAALDLAGTGIDLYDAVRRAFRAEWRFERHAFGAEWADAREQADRAATAIDEWVFHGNAVADAAASTREAGGTSIPRLDLRAWYVDGSVLATVAGSWGAVVEGFAAFSEAVRLDEAGVEAMEAGEFLRAGERFRPAADRVVEAHRRLAEAKADDAQAFQDFGLPIRRRCGPLREAYTTQVEAAAAALRGDRDRAETLADRAMDRIVTAEIEHSLPQP